ncbi:MAG: hypothetical protein BroJett025_05310 [Patescibacteria group bacterium]|nr:MAG: hypothetical protein BroJett025_05310 [Patescibacteria group bacterium]
MQEKTEVKVPTASSIFFKATLLSLLFVGVMLLVTALGVALFGYSKLNQFAKQAHTTPTELKTVVTTALQTTPKQTDGYKTILLLGVDTVTNKPNSPELTDTLLLLSINMDTGKISTLSLPRDLWAPAYQTRINALYEYGKEKYPQRPEQFPEEVISELTGITIDHTITLSLGTVAEIIDILGGIDVDVVEGFVDTQFPREDIDIHTATSQTQLYETISFEKGLQHMDGATTLKYIRSRKSTDLSQGTDVARSQRQQQVISALISRIQNFSIFKDVDAFAQLYVLYSDTFEKQFTKVEAIATLNYLLPYLETIDLNSNSLTIYPDDKNGVITNPPVSKYKGQWVYEIRDLANFQTEVKKSLRE